MPNDVKLRRTSYLLILALLWTFGAATLPATSNGGPEESQVHGIPVGPGLYRLFGTDPTLPTDDLEPLHFMVGNARFVGLGETIHTNGSFYEMKHRAFRYLVEEMGFRALGFETAWVRAEEASDYVRSCTGSSLEAVRQFYRVWQAKEVQDLLDWMCEWNIDNPNDPVHFYGFDIQNRNDENTAPLVDFLNRLDRPETSDLVNGILACDGAETSYFPTQTYPEELYKTCQEAIDGTERLFDTYERRIVRATSKEELGWARVHLTSARAWQTMIFHLFSDLSTAFNARDLGMAEVTRAIRDLRFPNARVALWAHNGHILKNGPDSSGGLLTQGTFLDEALGKFYVSIALGAYETHVEWPWINLCESSTPFLPNSTEEALLETGETALLVDFDPRGQHPPFFDPTQEHSIGGYSGFLHNHFDGMIYLESARSMDPIFTVPRCP